MERNNLENQIKNGLRNREIQPSQEAFEKFDFMLSKKTVRPKKFYNWVSFAAAILVFLTIGVLFWEKEPVINKERFLVETIAKENVKSPKEKYHEPQPTIFKKNEKKLLVLKEKKSSVPEVITKKTDSEQLFTESISKEENLLSESVVSIAEKATLPSIKSKIKVDPNLLLSNVDGELELSFREKLITKIKKDYQEVKVVLTTRNQQ